MSVPLSFAVFTIPYAYTSLKYKTEASFVPNVLLVSNSGFNSLIYFFRDFCKRRNRRKVIAPQNNKQAEPVAQTSRSRQKTDDKSMQEEASNKRIRGNRVEPSVQSTGSQQASSSSQVTDGILMVKKSTGPCKRRIRRSKHKEKSISTKSLSKQQADDEFTQNTSKSFKREIQGN